MIIKTYSGQDNDIHRQMDEIVSNQFEKIREVTLVFTGAGVETKADVGSLVDRFSVVDRNANISISRIKSDNRYAYFQASGAGTATLKVWKGQ
jgi:hypothetical protein